MLTRVYASVAYPDNTITTKEAKKNGETYSITFDGCDSSGIVESGFQVLADGNDENGNNVSGYVLGVGDVEVLERDIGIALSGIQCYAHVLDDVPLQPRKGDMCQISGNWNMYDGSQFVSMGKPDSYMISASVDIDKLRLTDNKGNVIDFSISSKVDVSSMTGFATKDYVDSQISDISSDIPTKTSQLYNDSGFITQHQSLTAYATKNELQSKAELSDVYGKSELSTVNLSGEYELSGTFSFDILIRI